MEKQIDFNEVLNQLIETGKKNDNVIYEKDIAQYYTDDTDEYDKI